MLGTFIATVLGGNSPKLGLDLQGGISVVLFPVEGSDLSTLDAAVDVIRNRVDGLGIVEPEVARQGDTITIDLPGADDRDDALALVGQTAQLQFRPVCGLISPFDPDAKKEKNVKQYATSPAEGCPGADTAAAQGGGQQGSGQQNQTQNSGASADSSGASQNSSGADPQTSPDQNGGGGQDSEPGNGSQDNASGESLPIKTASFKNQTDSDDSGSSQSTGSGQNENNVNGGEGNNQNNNGSGNGGTGNNGTGNGGNGGNNGTGSGNSGNQNEGNGNQEDPPEEIGEGVPNTPRKRLDGPLIVAEEFKPELNLRYVLGEIAVTGEVVSAAEAQVVNGVWQVNISFTSEGARLFDEAAATYFQQQLAIVLDGEVVSAPTIQQQEFGGEAVITGGEGGFPEGEAKDLALVLRYGSLPIQFDENEQTVQSVTPTLGKDQLSAGIVAGSVGLALVALFILGYYRMLGLVVWLGLILTGLFFYTLVTFMGDRYGLTLTLAGVTGLIVSVGVTVDSYIVYFERLKDEVRTGKTIRSSVDAGFTRSFRTIVAADLVSLIGAAILYWVAAGSVRGFALFLGISTVIDLVVSYFFMHPLVAIMARRKSLVRMSGFGIAAGLDEPEATI